MDFMIVHFTLLWFSFQSANTEKSKSTSFFKEILDQLDLEGSQNANSTLLDEQDYILRKIVLETHTMKLKFATPMYKRINDMQKLKLDVIKQMNKMLGDLEEERYLTMQSLKKADKPLDEYFSKMDLSIHDILRAMASDRLKTVAYEIYLGQLKKLKFKIYRWAYIQRSNLLSSTDELYDTVGRFTNFEDMPLEVSSSDVNGEDSLLKFDDDAEINELERLQRLSLMIQDELFEMPKRQNDDEDDGKPKMDPKNEFSEKIEVPRWLLTERDIEEIRSKYLKWMIILEESPHSKVASLKEKLVKSGYTLKSFCKTLAEYFNITSIMLECSSKGDSECEEMVMNILGQDRFKKFAAHLQEWEMSDLAGL